MADMARERAMDEWLKDRDYIDDFYGTLRDASMRDPSLPDAITSPHHSGVLYTSPVPTDYYEEGDKCEDCDSGKYVVRTNSKTGENFLGCSNFPECKSTKKLAEDNK